MNGVTKEMERLDDHERRIGILESNYATLFNKVQTVETGVTRVENTIMLEGQENRKLMTKMIDNQFNLSKKKMSTKEKVTLALITAFSTALGGGGIVLLFQEFIK